MNYRGSLTRPFGAIAAIAQRDVLKLLRDRPRLAVNLAFPVLLVAGLGSLLQPTVGKVTGLNAVTLAFTGVLAATGFQSASAGMISIVEDRETDFARVLFVTPVARPVLIAGKTAGECLVALVQGGCVLLGGVLVPLSEVAPWLNAVSAVMPLRYAVDLTRASYYAGGPGYREAVTGSPAVDALVTGGLLVAFAVAGSLLFSYRERHR
jgi:ABC-2 type transport system permease protein